MDAGKLFTLGGLATGGVSALSGTATSLAGAGVFGGGGFSIYTGTQIKDLPANSTSLFQKTHLKCVKDLFPNLRNLENSMRAEVGSTETTESNFKLSSVSASTGPVNGCLIVDTNYYEKDSKGALAATIELAATKGDYGIILLNSIGNIFTDSSYHFEYKAFFLKKTSNNWMIEAGYQWKDGFFVQDGGSISDIVWSGLDGLNLKAKWGSHQLCTSLSGCSLLEPNSSYLKSFRWVSPSSGSNSKSIWKALKIEGTTTGSGTTYKKDLWDGQEVPGLCSLSSYSSVVSLGLFKDGKWQKYKDSLTVDATSIKSWLEIFKEDMGEWKASH